MKEGTHRKLTERERNRMINVYASGPLTYVQPLDDRLMELDLLEFYDGTVETEAVVAKHPTGFFFAENGTVLPEWYIKEEKPEEEVPIEMDAFREMAADVIDEVTDAILEEYPDLKVKKEFLEECAEAAILYGPSYYNLESHIEDQLRQMFCLKEQEPSLNGPQKRRNLFIISHKEEIEQILDVGNYDKKTLQGFLDEFMASTDGYFGDSDFIRFLQSKGMNVTSHAFDALTTCQWRERIQRNQ